MSSAHPRAFSASRIGPASGVSIAAVVPVFSSRTRKP
jgi:hypothetical protein